MQREDIRIRSTGGGEFDCYLVKPQGSGKVPAIVLASAIHGVDEDLRAITDEFASHGYIAAAPDLFSRTIPGPLGRDDTRTKERSQPRLQRIKEGEADMTDTLAEIRKLPQFNGRAAAMGFCYGGPYAILGPKRLGYEAGVSCHGTQLIDLIIDLDAVTQPGQLERLLARYPYAIPVSAHTGAGVDRLTAAFLEQRIDTREAA